MNPQKPDTGAADAQPPRTSSADMQGDDAGTAASGADDSATLAAGVMKQTSKTPAEQDRPTPSSKSQESR